MLQMAIWVTGAYGALSLGGGVMGFVKAKSRASLIAGGLSGLILIGAAILATTRPGLGLTLAAIVSAALVARFAKAALSKRSPVAIVMLCGGIAVLASAGIATFG